MVRLHLYTKLLRHKDNHSCLKIFSSSKVRSYLYKNDNKHEITCNSYILDVFCGIYGIKEFLSTKFFNLIGSFQMETGCFADIPGIKYAQSTKLNIDSEKSFEEISDNLLKSKLKRFKRDDSVMRYGCSSHETGLAIVYFSNFFQKTIESLY